MAQALLLVGVAVVAKCSILWVEPVQSVEGSYPDIALQIFATAVDKVGTKAVGIALFLHEMSHFTLV